MAIKKQTITGNVTANVVTQNQQKMSIKNSSKVYSAISDYIYKNKIGSIIRELVSNAVDASNKDSKAVEIFIPDEKDVTNGLPFYVQDFGDGMSYETVTECYMTFFESTKENDKNVIGGFGIGGKTPFIYTKEFTIETTSPDDGIRRTFVAKKAVGDNEPTYEHLVHLDIVDSDIKGTKISFFIEKISDITSFVNETKKQTLFFKKADVKVKWGSSAEAKTITDFTSFSTDIIDDSFYNDVVFVRPKLGSALSGSNFNSIKSISRSNASKNNSINIGILLADVFYPYSIDKNSSVYKEFFKFTKSIQDKVAKTNIIHSRLTALLNSKIVNHSKNDFKDIKQKWVDFDSVFDYRNVSDMSVILKFSQTGNDSLSVTLSREEIDTNDENAKIILKHFEAFAKVLIKNINQYIKNMEELETAILDKLISQINSIPTSVQKAEKRFLIIDGAINEDWILKERSGSYSSFIAELKKNIAIVDLSSDKVIDIDENIKDTTLFDYLKNNLVDFGFKNPSPIHIFTEKEYSLIQEIIIENNFQYLFNNLTHHSSTKIIDDLFEQCDVNYTKRFNINNIYVKSSVFSRKDFDKQDIDAILSNKKTLVKNLFNIDGYESVTNNKILLVKNSADCLQSSFSFHCAVDVKNSVNAATELKKELESYVVSFFVKKVRHNAKLIYKTLKDFVDNIEKEKEQKLIKEKEKQKQLEIKERQEEIKNIKNKLYALMKDNNEINLNAIFDVYQENNIQHDIHYNQDKDNSCLFVREIKLLTSLFEQETIRLPTTISHDDLKQLKRMRSRSNNYQVKLFINEFLDRYTKFNNFVNNVICNEHNKFYFSCDAEQLLFKIMINSNMKIEFVDNSEVVSTINVSSINEYLQQEIQRVIKSVFYKRLVFNELLKQGESKNSDFNNVVADLSLLKNNLIDTLLKYVPKDSSSLKITSKNVLSVLNINQLFKNDFDCVFMAEKVNELIKTYLKIAKKNLIVKRNKIDLLDNFDIKSLNILPEFLLDIDDDEQQYSVNFEREINCLKDIDFELYIKHYSKYVDKLEKSSKLFLSNEQIEYLDQATLFFLKIIYDAFANKDGTIFSEKDMIGTIKSKYLFVHQELIYLIKKLLSQKIEEFKDKYNYKKYSLDVLTYFKILYFIERSHEVKKQD
jgi:HSP90